MNRFRLLQCNKESSNGFKLKELYTVSFFVVVLVISFVIKLHFPKSESSILHQTDYH